jgi:hypothetical protein
VGLSKNINAIPTSGIEATQLCFDFLGGTSVQILNEIDAYYHTGDLVTDVQAACAYADGVWTYELAIPLWTNWRNTLPENRQTLSPGEAVYLYSCMESGFATANGTDLTYDGNLSNPKFYEGAFNKAAALTLTVRPGDANKDGKVDVSDLGILAANYGTTAGATWELGDFNKDSKIDVSDLGILAANYGTGTGTSLDFNADALTLGLLVAEDALAKAEETPVTTDLGCGAAGLPLVVGLGLMGLLLTKMNE